VTRLVIGRTKNRQYGACEIVARRGAGSCRDAPEDEELDDGDAQQREQQRHGDVPDNDASGHRPQRVAADGDDESDDQHQLQLVPGVVALVQPRVPPAEEEWAGIAWSASILKRGKPQACHGSVRVIDRRA
jgi:hypothetical protein